ncbi:MAG: VirB4 family type IV secretion/conjugal transfer ATPase, partial [Gammaproteobacteria bacterium]|nr:VirB4 family type IV secretion/conjugal transfer ATPase [Gammaproteobacteria bacterium]
MRPRREREAAAYIPYSAHVAPTVVKTANGDYLQAFRLGGVGFECADDLQLNNWHERLNVLWRNLASPHLALWTHLVRRAVRPPPLTESGTGFARHLAQRYQRRLREQTLMVNELYLTLLYRPAVGKAVGLLARLLGRQGTPQALLHERETLEACAKLAQGLQVSLARYEPQALGTYSEAGRWYSTLLDYFALLINAEALRIPLAPAPLAGTLCLNRVLIGSEAIEYRTPSRTLAGAMLGIKEYATPSVVGMYNRLLTAPFELVLTQSFAFLSRAAGQGLLQRQHHRMANAGDLAVSQALQLREALDALSSNEFALGDHHLSLQVLVEIASEEEDPRRLQPLQEGMAQARSLLGDTGLTVAREDLALEAAFWAQLPGNFALRPRKAPISSRNFSAMVPFHNFPTGRPHGNHWGEALALLGTPARSPYYFSLHASDPHDPEGGSRKDTGHTLICGPTGSGKSVFIGFLVTLLAQQQVTQVIFDKDRGLCVLVHALGGAYFALRQGTPTGFNPLQLPDTPTHVEFLKAWLRLLVG